MALTIGVDVGGTKVAAGVADEAGHLLEELRTSTPEASYPDLVAAIAGVTGELADRHQVTGVGLAIAGNVRVDGSGVLFSPNIPGLADEPLRDDLQARTGLPVVVANDADAAAWAEFRFGGHLAVGEGGDDLLMVALGTGLGSGLVLDGRLYRGAHGFAGEAGHLPVVRDGRPCPCGSRGCWERYASGTALLEDFREAGGDPTLGGPEVTQAARAGDPLATAAFQAVGQWLGHGLAGLVAVLDPGVIVVGGGLADAGELLLGPAR
ncbi:MAG: ROK family protein, partial [Actinomycetota bacterium]|nr:ROK family protein [Actinomycetota bacterium]